jgi:hypothetical protein
MATGSIVFIGDSEQGVFGYVVDDALAGETDREYQVRFDKRSFSQTKTVLSVGHRVSFEYISLQDHKPRMKFNSMKLLTGEKTNG